MKGYMSAEPVRWWIGQLHERGMTVAAIADGAGLPVGTVNSILYEKGVRQLQHVGIDTGARILAVEPRHLRAIGTRRRLQALAAIGWSTKALARRYPSVGTSALDRARCGEIGEPSRVHGVARQAYDELWNVRPEGRGAHQQRINAQRNGWAPPLAWDDDTIDDPDAEPSGVGISVHSPAKDEAAWRLELGESIDAIARDLGVSAEYLTRAMKEAA